MELPGHYISSLRERWTTGTIRGVLMSTLQRARLYVYNGQRVPSPLYDHYLTRNLSS